MGDVHQFVLHYNDNVGWYQNLKSGLSQYGSMREQRGGEHITANYSTPASGGKLGNQNKFAISHTS